MYVFVRIYIAFHSLDSFFLFSLILGIYTGDDGSAAGGSEAMEKMSTLEGAFN